MLPLQSGYHRKKVNDVAKVAVTDKSECCHQSGWYRQTVNAVTKLALSDKTLNAVSKVAVTEKTNVNAGTKVAVKE